MNFAHPDLIDSDKFNRILWRGIMGDDKAYPEPGVKLSATQLADTDRD